MEQKKNANAGVIMDFDQVLRYFDSVYGPLPDREKHWQGWSVHLRLGPEVYLSSESCVTHLAQRGWACLKPGDFALLLTDECLKLEKDVMAFISLRFKYKQRGLINVSGFHVDPTYHGRLVFSVFNAGPNDIVFQRGDELFMIFFQKLERAIDEDKERHRGPRLNITSEDISAICGKSATLSQNASRIEKLEANFKFLSYVVGILATVCVALLGLRLG